MYVHVHRIIKVYQQSKLHQCTIAGCSCGYYLCNNKLYDSFNILLIFVPYARVVYLRVNNTWIYSKLELDFFMYRNNSMYHL